MQNKQQTVGLLSPQESSNRYRVLLDYFIAGGIAGAASRTVVSPLERLKIIYQVQGTQRQYVGVIPSLSKMWKEEGIVGMFRGNGINVVRIMPYSAVQFTSYETFKKFFTSNGQTELNTPKRLLSGALAGICSVVSTYPLDLVRSRLSVLSASIARSGPGTIGQDLSMIGMTIRIYKEEGGARGLYRGINPTIIGVAPYVGLNFAIYEFLRKLISPRDGGQPSAIRKLFCGGLSGAVSQTITYPLDVLRRRMQVTGLKSLGYEYKNTFSAIQSIIKNEGYLGFYKGLIPNLLKVSPSIGVSFVTYEFIKGLLNAEA